MLSSGAFAKSDVTAPPSNSPSVNDFIEIRSSTLSGISGRFQVDATGYIQIPRLGSIGVATRSLTEITVLIHDRVESILGISDELDIRHLVSKDSLVGIATRKGQVLFVPVQRELSLQDYWTLVRLPDGQSTSGQFVTNFWGMNIPVSRLAKPGDRLWLPFDAVASKATLLGGVVTPGIYDVTENTVITDFVTLGGGITPRADGSRIFIQRQGLTLGPFDVVKDGGTPVRVGDTVRVSVKESIAYVSVTGLVRTSKNIEWREGLTALKLLEEAGGVLDERCVIEVKSIVNPNRKSTKVKYKELKARAVPDIVLEPNDIVEATIK